MCFVGRFWDGGNAWCGRSTSLRWGRTRPQSCFFSTTGDILLHGENLDCCKLPFSSASTTPLQSGSCLCTRHMPDSCCFPVHGLFLNFLMWTPAGALPSIGPDCPSLQAHFLTNSMLGCFAFFPHFGLLVIIINVCSLKVSQPSL